MALSRDIQTTLHRLVMIVLGAAAAFALWALTENWKDPAIAPSLYLALLSFVSVYSIVALALAGPVPILRALYGALILAVPMTVLMVLAGQRHVNATDLLDDPPMLGVAVLLLLFATPFLSVWLQDRTRWDQYATLFDTAWTMAVRCFAAWVFVIVFWMVAFLSNVLLGLVDVNLVEQIFETDWVRFGLTGAVLGLGLAVVYEIRETVSPYLILRLLRLLVPLVLVVVTVFLLALPFRGINHLFGDFSGAGILMGAAIVSITLISAALDQSNDAAVSTRGIRTATRALAILLPFLTVLAAWAVVLRVQQYGWTPDRVLAACMAVFLVAYGIGYCAVAVLRRSWMDRIRRVNVIMALAVIGMTVLWLTPVLNPYRIATSSQVARFERGDITLDELALWSMANDWGKAGKAGLTRLETMTSRADYDELVAQINMVRTLLNPFQFERAVADRNAPDQAVQLAKLMVVRPEGPLLTADIFADLPPYRLTQWLEGCQRKLPDGRAGCVMIRGQFTPAADARAQGIVVYLTDSGRAQANFVMLRDDAAIVVRDVFDPVADTWPRFGEDIIAQALDGQFDIRPSNAKALHIGGLVLIPGN